MVHKKSHIILRIGIQRSSPWNYIPDVLVILFKASLLTGLHGIAVVHN